ncbi:MAG: HAMP domain-containing histidine kinase [Prevotella sp.]|nr:HAMP domain-containing histidine kinase [Prevotella sp.]
MTSRLKISFILAAVIIAAASLIVSHRMVTELANEERSRMEIWAEAMHNLASADENTDLGLVVKVLEQNHTIPVIVVDKKGNVQMWRNIEMGNTPDSLSVAAGMARKMQKKGMAIRVDLQPDSPKSDYLLVCYDDSVLLTRLAYYPYIQLAVVMLFVALAILALLSSKRAEQNKVWVGLSKETAHQLGTPISSLMAWMEILKENYPNDDLLPEMDKDVSRLRLIADRFSKIGSTPEKSTVSLEEVLGHVVQYMSRRTSGKVHISYTVDEGILVTVNPLLFEWVFENLCKNAVDAMEGRGDIHMRASISTEERLVIIDVSDNGKGIEPSKLKEVFNPGYTTKKRGWGLGLSLSRRIIEEYHDGKIYVLYSEKNKGTTFRIELKKQPLPQSVGN